MIFDSSQLLLAEVLLLLVSIGGLLIIGKYCFIIYKNRVEFYSKSFKLSHFVFNIVYSENIIK